MRLRTARLLSGYGGGKFCAAVSRRGFRMNSVVCCLAFNGGIYYNKYQYIVDTIFLRFPPRWRTQNPNDRQKRR